MKKQPKPSNVKLQIRTSFKSGYTQAKDGDNSLINYWYKFTDGNNGNGNSKSGAKYDALIVKVRFKGNGANTYKFDDCYWKNNPGPSDMAIVEVDDTDIVIWNLARVIGDHYYSVVAIHKDKGDEIHCDPRITNTWPTFKIKSVKKKKKKAAKRKVAKKKASKKAGKKK